MSINNTLDKIAKPFTGIAPWILRLSLGISFFILYKLDSHSNFRDQQGEEWVATRNEQSMIYSFFYRGETQQ